MVCVFPKYFDSEAVKRPQKGGQEGGSPGRGVRGKSWTGAARGGASPLGPQGFKEGGHCDGQVDVSALVAGLGVTGPSCWTQVPATPSGFAQSLGIA